MPRSIEFPPFRLDLDANQLRRGTEKVPLRPKALAVLRHLATRPGCAVSKADLMAAVWPDTHVDEASLKVCINELRRALGEDARHPVVLETVRGSGYRFLPEVAAADLVRPSRVPPCFVGRQDELAALAHALDDARRGVRRVVFVSGDAGIGKTSLVEWFLDDVAGRTRPADDRVAVGVGHCADRPGAGDVFQPFIEGLAEACRGPDEERLRDRLRDVAPSWLLHLPGPLPPAEREALRRAVAGATRAAVVRELGQALRAAGELRPLILVLEDLHRADEATHDALAQLARGDDRAHVLIVGTVRPVETPGAPSTVTLVHELTRRHLARELRLAPFGAADVRSYLTGRFGIAAPGDLADTIVAHTGGNPLFVTAVAERLDALAANVPETLRHLLVDDLAHLPAAERLTLEAAATAGLRFVAPALALALDETVAAIEARLTAMSRLRTPIRACGTRRWVDGADAAAFEFVHAVHRDVVLEQVPPARRAHLHAQVGLCLERALPERMHAAGDRAPELARHFDEAGDVERARRYHEQAGMLATERHAHGTAVLHLERALALLPADATTDELRLRTALGPMLMNARGFASADVERNYARALALCDVAGEQPELFPVLEGLQSHYAINGRMMTAHALSKRMQALGVRLGDRAMQVEADHTTGIEYFKLARLDDAVARLGAALARYDDAVGEQGFRWCGHDGRVCCAAHLGVCRWHGAAPAAAADALADALDHARRLRQPASLAIALTANAWLRIQRADPGGALELLDELTRLAADDDLPFWDASGALFTGWAQTLAGDFDRARMSLDRANAGAAALGPHVLAVERRLLTAGFHTACGAAPAALALLAEAEALHAEHGEVYLHGDIALVRGTALLAAGSPPEAHGALHAALAFGERHGFRPLALRAALLLAHCDDGGARAALARVVSGFAGDADLPDLAAARDRLAT